MAFVSSVMMKRLPMLMLLLLMMMINLPNVLIGAGVGPGGVSKSTHVTREGFVKIGDFVPRFKMFLASGSTPHMSVGWAARVAGGDT